MTDEQKKWIDEASYEALLRRWRNAPAGDTIFIDDAGDYYKEAMIKKRNEVGPAAHVTASKKIGWDG